MSKNPDYTPLPQDDDAPPSYAEATRMLMNQKQSLPTFDEANYQQARNPNWRVAFWLFTLVFMIIGGVATAESSANYKHFFGHTGGPKEHKATTFLLDGLIAASPFIIAGLASCILIGMIRLKVMQVWPRGYTWFAVLFYPALLVLAGVAGCIATAVLASNADTHISHDDAIGIYVANGGLILLGLALGGCVFFWRRRVELTARVMEAASTVLLERPSVFGVSLLVPVVFFVFSILWGFFMVRAELNGDIVKEVDPDTGKEHEVMYINGFGAFAMTFVGAVGLWIASTFTMVFRGTISNLAGSWYFCPEDSSKASAFKSLGRACGPMFGSYAFAAFAVTLAKLADDAARRNYNRRAAGARSGNGGGAAIAAMFIACCVSCLVSCVRGILEFLTKWAVLYIGITGQDLLSGGRSVMGMFKRHLISTIVVDWIANFVLTFADGILALIIAATTLTVSLAVSPNVTPIEAVFVGFATLILAFMTLNFFAVVMRVCMDSIFICYAIDKDNGTVTNQRVHGVYDEIAPTDEDKFRKRYASLYKSEYN